MQPLQPSNGFKTLTGVFFVGLSILVFLVLFSGLLLFIFDRNNLFDSFAPAPGHVPDVLVVRVLALEVDRVLRRHERLKKW